MPTCRVLIVDDQRDVRRVLRAALETLGPGIQVTAVPSGEEAILVISRQPVDVLIADVRLPGISGFELIERTRVRNPELRLVLITGMTDEKIRRQVELARADAFFYKPIAIGSFLDTMQELLGISPSRLPANPPPVRPEPEDTRPLPPRRDLASPKSQPGPTKSPGQRIQDAAAALRLALNSACTVVIDAGGELIAQDGRLPVDSPAWNDALQAAVGMLTSELSLSKGWVFLQGEALDIAIARLSVQMALVVAAPRRVWRNISVAQAADRIESAAAEIRGAGPIPVEAAGVEAAGQASISAEAAAGSGGPVIDVEDDGALPDLAELFNKIREKSLKPGEVDAFWDSAAENQAAGPADKGAISYEQARRLGLAPDED